jgi:hypothetical protein
MALRAEPVVVGAVDMPYKRENFIYIFNNLSVFKNLLNFSLWLYWNGMVVLFLDGVKE